MTNNYMPSCDLLRESRVIARKTSLSKLASGSVLYSAIDYHLSAPGSETRAEFCLSASMALGLNSDAAVRLAASVETLHNASLIQDDLQDQDELRRDRPTIWKKFGRDIAMNTTDLLLANAFELVVTAGAESALELVSIMNLAIVRTLQGQSKDLTFGQKNNVNEAIAIAKEKSGPFFSLSLQLPLVLTGLSNFLETADEAGSAFGIGYQIFDDIKDRELDRMNSNISNMALLIEDNANAKNSAPSCTAKDLAYQFLNHAVYKAAALPHGCGRLLELKCSELLRELDREAA